MGPDDEKQLRVLMMKAHQLPDPPSHYLRRVSKRFSRAGQLLKGMDIRQQRERMEKLKKETK